MNLRLYTPDIPFCLPVLVGWPALGSKAFREPGPEPAAPEGRPEAFGVEKKK